MLSHAANRERVANQTGQGATRRTASRALAATPRPNRVPRPDRATRPDRRPNPNLWRPMDTSTIRALIELNNEFYARHAESFSATRSAPWDGWGALVRILGERGWELPALPQGTRGEAPRCSGRAPAILDLACGNLRFERFLTEALPGSRFEFHAVDSCPALANGAGGEPASCTFHPRDILESLMSGDELIAGVPACRLSVCFGFMHHVPSAELRQKVLDALLGHTAPEGLIVLSFWQFMNDDRLARKAARADEALRMAIAQQAGAGGAAIESRADDALGTARRDIEATQLDASHRDIEAAPLGATHRGIAEIDADIAPLGTTPLGIDIAQLDENDHFLGWQADPSPLRYCHHFDEREIDDLVASVGTGAREVARYSADGASGTLNRYLVLERLP